MVSHPPLSHPPLPLSPPLSHPSSSLFPHTLFIVHSQSLFVAILFRQTNVVWVVFVAGTTTLAIVEPEMRHLKEENGGHENVGIQWLLLLVRATFQRFMSLVYALWPHLLVVAAFVAFVVVNGSIVVGDKSHHTASLHFPQLYYFCR